jgi:glycine hydroxymethyltransferase
MVGAYLLADVSHISGLIVGGVYPSPAPYAHIITTTTHKSLRGPRGAMILTTHRGLEKNPDLAKQIDKAVFPGLQGGPHENAIAGIGVALHEASTKKFATYAKQIVTNAKALADVLQSRGFELVSGGTDSHLLLIDLQTKGLIGNTVAEGCEAVGIVLNRNAVPFDPNPPFYPSGIRLGTPGVTSRGMKKDEMKRIGECIDETVEALRAAKQTLGLGLDEEKSAENRARIIAQAGPKIKRIKVQIDTLCKRYPLKPTYV